MKITTEVELSQPNSILKELYGKFVVETIIKLALGYLH